MRRRRRRRSGPESRYRLPTRGGHRGTIFCRLSRLAFASAFWANCLPSPLGWFASSISSATLTPASHCFMLDPSAISWNFRVVEVPLRRHFLTNAPGRAGDDVHSGAPRGVVLRASAIMNWSAPPSPSPPASATRGWSGSSCKLCNFICVLALISSVATYVGRPCPALASRHMCTNGSMLMDAWLS